MSSLAVLSLNDGSVHDGVRYTSSILMPADTTAHMPRLRAGYSRAGRVRRWLANVVLVLCTIGILSFAAPVKAEAAVWDPIIDMFCGQDMYFAEPVADSGVGAMGFRPQGLPENLGQFNQQQHTAYEKYGMSGSTWTVYRGERGGDKNSPLAADEDASCLPAMEIAMTSAANGVFTITKAVAAVSIWLYESASDLGGIINSDLVPTIAKVIEGGDGVVGLRDALYLEFLAIPLMFGALYIGYKGLVKRETTSAFSAFAWMAVVVVAGCLILWNPTIIARTSNAIVSSVSTSVMSTVAGAATGSMKADNICALPAGQVVSGSGGAFAGQTTIPKNERVTRQTSCSLWATFVYTPWVIGQYGVNPGSSKLAASDETPIVNLGGSKRVQNWAMAQLDAQSIDYATAGMPDSTQAVATKDANMKAVVAYANSDAALKTTWRGYGGADRLGVATASLVSAGLGMLLVVVFSASILIYQVALVLLALLAPLMLLIGVHPGAGRRTVLKWVSMVAGAIAKQVLAATMLGFTLFLYIILMQRGATSSGAGVPGSNYAVTVMFMVVLTIAFLIYYKKLRAAVTPNWGGGMDLRPGHMGRGAAVTTGAVAGGGAAAVGLIAGAATGNASTVGTGLKTLAKGTAGGARSGAGAFSAGGGAVRGAGAGHRAASAATTAVRTQKVKAAEEGAAQERVQAHEADPHVYAAKKDAQEREQQQDVRDYERHSSDPEYLDRLRAKHGGDLPAHVQKHEREKRERAEAAEYRAQGHDPAYRAKVEAKHGGELPRHLRDITPDSAPRPVQPEPGQPATARPEQQPEQAPRQEDVARAETPATPRPQSGQPRRPQAPATPQRPEAPAAPDAEQRRPQAPRSGQSRRPDAGLPPRQGR